MALTPGYNGVWKLAGPGQWCVSECETLGLNWKCNEDEMKTVTTATAMLDVITKLAITCTGIAAFDTRSVAGGQLLAPSVQTYGTNPGMCYFIDNEQLYPQGPSNLTCSQGESNLGMLCFCDAIVDPNSLPFALTRKEEEEAIVGIALAVLIPFCLIFCFLNAMAVAVVAYLVKRRGRHRAKKLQADGKKLSSLQMTRRGFAKLGLAGADAMADDALAQAEFSDAQDGLVSWVESDSGAGDKKVLWRLFEVADSDGSGSIDMSELRSVLPRSFSNLEVAKVMTILDVDGDDMIDFVEFQRIKEALTSVRSEAAAQAKGASSDAAHAFVSKLDSTSPFDGDSDGVVEVTL